MKKILRGLYGLSGLCILLSLLGGVLLGIRADMLPGQVECWMVPPNPDSVKTETLVKLQEDKALPMLKEWTWAAVRNGTLVSSRAVAADVEVRHIGYGYGEVAGVRMLKGRFPWKEEVEASEPVMVVDEKLAFTLFGRVNCLGYEVEYGGKKFEIIGVCVAEGLFTKKAEYRAFVPGGIDGGSDRIGIIGNVSPGRGTIAGASLKNALNGVFTGSKMDVYDLQEQKLLLRQKLFLHVRLVLLIMFAWLSGRLYNWLKAKVRDWKTGLEQRYLREFARVYWIDLMLASALLAGFVSLVVLLWGWTRFDVILPAGLIPDDLTDVGQFVKNINRVILEHNREATDLPASVLQVNVLEWLADEVILVFWLSLSARFGVLRPWRRKVREKESRFSAIVLPALDRVCAMGKLKQRV